MNLNEAKVLACELMQQHGLLDSGWYFEFDKAKCRYGCCFYSLKKITLSAPLTEIRDESWVRNTVLHEIAHALVGRKNGHNEVWRAKAIELGCNGSRCSDDVSLKGKWKAVCPNNHIFYRHRKPKRKSSCGKCSPVFDTKYLLDYSML